jgi:uncharacterized protein (TIGR02145 family)
MNTPQKIADKSGEGAGSFLIQNNSASSFLLMDKSGRMGIGQTNPAYRLDVKGDINFTGLLYKNGSPFGGDLWNQNGSHIFYNKGNVGIGVTTPISNLDVRGLNTDDGGVINLGNSDLSHRLVLFGGRENDPNPFINWKQGDPLRFTTDEGGWSEKMIITSEGKVGIGTSTPTSKLDVVGEINLNNNKIQNVADPVNVQDAATKAYVEKLLKDLGLIANNYAGTMTDIQGNVYKTVQIGSQVWMAENLRTARYKDDTAIPQVTDNTAWDNLTTPGYCWYNNEKATYGNIYGALYNWYAVNTWKLCPTGWHVPSDAEWTTLTTFLGGVIVAGGKMKEAGTTHWQSPNTGATNESGFSGLPGGYRLTNGYFSTIIGYNGYWWSSSEYSTSSAWYRYLTYDTSTIYRGVDYKEYGFSVRCVRD